MQVYGNTPLIRPILPLIGVNTFLGGKESHVEGGELELMRSTDAEKDQQVSNVEVFRQSHHAEASPELLKLQQVARDRQNTFESLMDAAKDCSLGSMSHALYDVGGEYRRNM
jgi:methylmalonyl-CoA mutase